MPVKPCTHPRGGLEVPHFRGIGAAGHASRPNAGTSSHVPNEPKVTSKVAMLQLGYFFPWHPQGRAATTGGGGGESHAWVEGARTKRGVPAQWGGGGAVRVGQWGAHSGEAAHSGGGGEKYTVKGVAQGRW